MTSALINSAEDGARMEHDGRMDYSDYLQLGKILDAQSPVSGAHDEMLFIVQHQTSELWMKLAIHEIRAAREAIRTDSLQAAFKMLSRVACIFEQLNNAWDVLRTVTPSEYTQFREELGQSSGFQSWQYRKIEFLAGNKNESLLRPHTHNAETSNRLNATLDEPSLYDEALLLVHREGLPLPAADIDRDWRQPRAESEAVLAAWQSVYEDPEHYWTLYNHNLAEKLLTLMTISAAGASSM